MRVLRMLLVAVTASLAAPAPLAHADRIPVYRPTGIAKAVSTARAGECDTFRPVYDAVTRAGLWGKRGAPGWGWFRSVLYRETRCGVDTYNDRTGDSGLLQLSPVHRKWIARELGFEWPTIRSSWTRSLIAAAALYRKVGTCAWRSGRYCR